MIPIFCQFLLTIHVQNGVLKRTINRPEKGAQYKVYVLYRLQGRGQGLVKGMYELIFVFFRTRTPYISLSAKSLVPKPPSIGGNSAN